MTSESVMHEQQIFEMLRHDRLEQRLAALEILQSSLEELHGSCLPFTDCQELFILLSMALEDAEHDVKIPCLRLMRTFVPCLATDGPLWISLVLPAVVKCFGDSRGAVHLLIVQVLQSSLGKLNFQSVMQAIIDCGLENANIHLRKVLISFLPMLFNVQLKDRNFFDLVHSLLACLTDRSLHSDVLKALQDLSNLVGREKFSGYIEAMPNRLQVMYVNAKTEENADRSALSNANTKVTDSNKYNQKHLKSSYSKNDTLDSYSNGGHASTHNNSLIVSSQFGIFPSHIIHSVLDDLDPQSQSRAADELKSTVEQSRNLNGLAPYLSEFIDFLVMLLDDSNSKINKTALDVFAVMFERFDASTLKPHISRMMIGLTKHLGDNIPFFREGIMKLAIQLMQISSPISCLSVICENLSHRNSRIRHESVNMIIIALLTFPSSDFDLNLLCRKIALALFDTKRQVRQSALECLAVLCQALGPYHRDVLSDAVRDCERSTGIDGALGATHARLANLQLPKIGNCGTVEYVTSGSRGNGSGNTADVEWILSASNRHGSSAHSCLSDSVVSMDRSEGGSPLASTHLESATLFTRSRPSMRKSLAKMPWDSGSNTEFSKRQHMRRIASSGDVAKAAFSSYPGQQQHFPNEFSLANGESTGACPLPTGPRLVRSGSVKRISSCSAVPPIRNRNHPHRGKSGEVTQSCWFPNQVASGYNSRNESSDSTRSLRNSAGKRRVAKMFGKLEKKEGSGLQDENSKEQWSMNSFNDHGNSSKVDSVEAKNSIGRQIHYRESQLFSSKGISPTSPESAASHLSSNPLQEIGFRNNPKSGGNGFTDGSEVQPYHQPVSKARDSRRLSKGLIEKPPANGFSATANVSNDDRPIKPAAFDGIYGLNVYNLDDDVSDERILSGNGHQKVSSDRNKRPELEEDFGHTKVNLESRQRQNFIGQFEAKRQQLNEETKREKQKRLESANQIGYDISDDSSEANVCVVEKPPLKHAPRDRNKFKTKKSSPAIASSASAPTAVDVGEDPSELKPSSDPTGLLSEALRQLAQDEDWELKCKGLKNLRRVAMHHPKAFAGQTVSVGAAVVLEVKNLRSSVSILAMKCCADMYAHLKSDMEVILDQTVSALLIRFGDANNFIREEADKSLKVMTENITPQRALCCLISVGAKHRNPSIRALTAHLILSIAESLGPGHVLSGVRDITDKILPVAATFLIDGSPEARFCARKIFHMLVAHQDFDKIVAKFLSKEMLSDIQDKLDQLKTRGLDDVDTNSTRGRRMASVERKSSSSFRHHSASRPSSDSSVRSKRIDEASKGEVMDVVKNLATNDFRERCKGIEQLRDMTTANLTLFASSVSSIFDRFVPCLRDANSKVTHLALQVLQEIVPIIHSHIGGFVSLTVEPLVANLASNNREIREISTRILDLFMEFFDPALLLPVFTLQAQNCVSMCKPGMIQRVTYLVSVLNPNKRKCLALHVLPLLWHLFNALAGSGTASSNLRSATSDLVKALHAVMGESLSQASLNSNVTQRSKALLKEMIEK